MKITTTSHIYEWNKLIKEAQQRCCNSLNEELEAYLSFALVEYLKDTSLLQGSIGAQFIQNISVSGASQKQQLKALGDKCLLITGLFPGQITRRLVSATYFSSIGQASYDCLANLETTKLEQLYGQLASDFYFLIEVLLALRPLNQDHPLLNNPQFAYAVWQETKSDYMKQFFIMH